MQSDADALLKSAVRLPRHPGISVLAPSDMVLHSATHLFHNEEFTHGLRDLVDIHELLRHFSSDPAFWSALLSRAEELDLARPLYYALAWSTRLLGTEIPREIIEHADRHAPSAPVRAAMDYLLARRCSLRHGSADALGPTSALCARALAQDAILAADVALGG
jgi:hypothetical protein